MPFFPGESNMHRCRAQRATVLVALAVLAMPLWPSSCLTLRAQDPQLTRRRPDTEAARSRLDRRVTLDIEVGDSTGKPVRGLTQRDFLLLDNGQPTTPTSFQEIDGPKGEPPTEAILLVDAMNATFQDVGIMRQGVETFLRQNQGQLPLPVSIVFLTETGTQLAQSSVNGLDLVKAFSRIQTPIRMFGSAQGTSGAADRFQRSIIALQNLAGYEGSRPGRKLLLWLGPGWPLLSEARTATPSPLNARRYYKSIVDTTTELRRAHITLYSVAPLNLSHDSLQSPLLYQAFLKGVAGPSQADSPNLGVQVLATHSGGLVLNKNGDLVAQINHCLQDASAFYEVTFDAAPGDELGVYHPIDIKVDRSGSTARTDTAYYAGLPQFTADSAAARAGSADDAARKSTLQAQARLVVLDVTALDAQGMPISNLRADDFRLLDEERPQKIGDLEEHRGLQPAPRASAAALQPGEPLVATNKPAGGSLWNVLAVDLLNTPEDERGRLQQQLQAFAAQLPAGTPVALVAMTGSIKVLSSFSDGPSGLMRALQKGLGPLEVGVPANLIERNEIQESRNVADTASVQNKANNDVERQAQRAQMTLDDLASIARWLKSYPGRKNVFWLSPGFALEGQPFGVVGYDTLHPAGPGTPGVQKLPMQDKADKELETSRVAVYPIDDRGVAVADIAGETSADTGGNFLLIGKDGDRAINVKKDSDRKAAQQAEMLEIARTTGGVAQFNNDITATLLQAFSQQSSYYTIAFTPQDALWDGKYHRLRLLVDRPDTRLVYRQGYYARAAEAEPPPTTDQFKAALVPNTPLATSVLFTAAATASGDTAEVQYTIEPSTVEFLQAIDGRFQADLDCAILEYSANGKVLEKSLIRLSEKTGSTGPDGLPTQPFSAKQTIPLKPAAATLVVGVRDRATGRFGTVAVPVAAR